MYDVIYVLPSPFWLSLSISPTNSHYQKTMFFNITLITSISKGCIVYVLLLLSFSCNCCSKTPKICSNVCTTWAQLPCSLSPRSSASASAS